jgi:16S rRNA (uracil1498-N3)-methyltransferase
MGLPEPGTPRVTIHRFFVDAGEMAGEHFPLPSGIEHQVVRVLRLRDGDEIVLLDGRGAEARCRLEAAGSLSVVGRGEAAGEPRHRLTICQALLKGDGLERVVQQGTELGVAGFRLFVSERCVPRQLSPSRLQRLRAIARESAEQSERGMVPEVGPPVPLTQVLDGEAVLLFERTQAQKPRLGALEPPSTLIIGPEGGFSPAEVDAAERAGVRIAGLGPRILRSESVSIAAAAVVLSRAGDFA